MFGFNMNTQGQFDHLKTFMKTFPFLKQCLILTLFEISKLLLNK